MSPDFVVAFIREAISLMLVLAAPVLGVSLVTGLVISIFQAVTQIHESTLSFIPKMLVTFLTLMLILPWMAQKLLKFSISIFGNLSSYAK